MSSNIAQAEGLPARAAALDVLLAALHHRGGLDEAMARPPFSRLEPRDRGFARALVMSALRRLRPIDLALDGRLRKPPPEAVKGILRLGAAQLFYMDAPDFAVVDTSVALAAARDDARPFKGLVNAVLRALARDGAPPPDAGRLAPDWLTARWRAAYDPDSAEQNRRRHRPGAPERPYRPRPGGHGGPRAGARRRDPAGGQPARAGLKGDLADWPGFAEGRWWVQDAAAAVPARLLLAGRGQSALDLCAAPGGKILQLAAAGAT